MAEIEQSVAAEAEVAAPQAAEGLKRKRPAAKTMSLEALAAKITQLNQEADQEEAEVAEVQAAIAALEAKIVAKREKAHAKRNEAQKARKDYVRKQCEEELSKLEGSVPKRPSNPFFHFRNEQGPKIEKTSGKGGAAKKIGEMWAALSEEERKVYKDKHEEETTKWREWNASEEGQRILAERDEVLRKVKASEAEQLAGVLAPQAPAEAAGTPSKSRAETVQTEVVATPPKQRKTVSRPSGSTKRAAAGEPRIDEAVAAEAEKAELLGALCNLAGRAEVKALGKTDAELLEVLKVHGGIVNVAKRSLLGDA